jgi:hypothetical protein
MWRASGGSDADPLPGMVVLLPPFALSKKTASR